MMHLMLPPTKIEREKSSKLGRDDFDNKNNENITQKQHWNFTCTLCSCKALGRISEPKSCSCEYLDLKRMLQLESRVTGKL
jgi:hypothetical protein